MHTYILYFVQFQWSHMKLHTNAHVAFAISLWVLHIAYNIVHFEKYIIGQAETSEYSKPGQAAIINFTKCAWHAALKRMACKD